MLESHNAPLHIGAVSLIVQDIDKVANYYRSKLGLEQILHAGERVSLGSGDEAYLHLMEQKNATRESPRSAGLFHTAFLLPSRAALGRWFTQAHQRGVEFEGASDHGVSEAFYLTDPEGNGVEVYADRARQVWPRGPHGYNMTTERMDIEAVAAAGADAPQHAGFPTQARIGHVHVRVGDIKAVQAFYVETLGLDEMDRRPGGVFYGAGGYHHHLATNQWQSAGASARSGGTTGLDEVEIRLSDTALWQRFKGRHHVQTDGAIRLSDPAGIKFSVRAA